MTHPTPPSIFHWTKVYFVEPLIAPILDLPGVSKPGWFSQLHSYFLVCSEPNGQIWCYTCKYEYKLYKCVHSKLAFHTSPLKQWRTGSSYLGPLSQQQSSQRVWAKKKHEKKNPFLRKKTWFQQKKALFAIISILKRVFCLPLLHKISPFNMFKTINYLFFNISNTSYFTKQQTPLMIIISHNFKEMIFFIRID